MSTLFPVESMPSQLPNWVPVEWYLVTTLSSCAIISTISSFQSGNAFFVSRTEFFAPSIPWYSNPPIKWLLKLGTIILSSSSILPFDQTSWYFFTAAIFLSMSTFCAVELHLQKAMIRIEKEKMNGAVFSAMLSFYLWI